MDIEKTISQYVSRQFPSFYQEEGENFVAFVKAYYEWMEDYSAYTIYLEDPVGSFSIGDKVIQYDPYSPARVTEVGSNYIKIIGNYASWVERDPIWRLDAANLTPRGVVSTLAVNNDLLEGTNTAFMDQVAAGDIVSLNAAPWLEVEYVASDNILKLKYQIINFSATGTGYKVFKVSQKTITSTIERQPNPIGMSRYLLDYRDIDTTLDMFIDHFIKKYLYGIPSSTLGDKRLLLKNIISFYRAKGTLNSYQFLYRLLYNEPVEVYIPGGDMLKPSDSSWVVPQYIEVSDSPYLKLLLGKRIYNGSGSVSAIVEDYSRMFVKNKTINALLLSHVDGEFNYNDKIVCDGITLDPRKCPIVYGSLTAITIENGGYGYSVGDALNIEGSGTGATALVSSVKNQSGKVKFTLVDGGSGYSLEHSVVTVSSVYNVVTNTAPTTITYTNADAGLRVFQNTASSNTFVGDIIQSIPGHSYFIKKISGAPDTSKLLRFTANANTLPVVSFVGGGSGASFQVGTITDTIVTSINRDYIGNSYNVTLDSAGYSLTIDNASGAFSNGETVTSFVTLLPIEIIYGLDPRRLSAGEQITYAGHTAYVGEDLGILLKIKSYGLTPPNIGDTVVGSSGASGIVSYVGAPYTAAGSATITNISSNVLTVSQPTSPGYYLDSFTISGVGSGYANGDVITLTGSPGTRDASVIVHTNNFGSILSYTIYSSGNFNSNSPLPTVKVVSSTGTGIGAVLVPVLKQNAGVYIVGSNITGTTSSTTGIISSALRKTDWTQFPLAKAVGNLYYNLDDTFDDVLTVERITNGRIASLKNIYPGSGYSINPIIEVIDSEISLLGFRDVDLGGTIKGMNAYVTGQAGTLTGVIDSVKITNSGYGYGHMERLSLTSNTNPTAAYSSSIISRNGRGEGYWADSNSFLSSNKYIIDSSYYQEYSYELRSKLPFEKYKDVLTRIAHPSGFAMFGSFLLRDAKLSSAAEPVSISINQTTDA
jgi:hypothetical protein